MFLFCTTFSCHSILSSQDVAAQYTGFYVIAKVEEAADKLIYKWTHHIVSGHTLKHLFAAMVPVFLTLMLMKRVIETER